LIEVLMQIKHDLPNSIREIENAWIPLGDGTRLAARIWLPQDAEENPVPALLEYLPYRKSDGTAVRDALRHPYFAGHGYASLRVDMRGSGDSDGILYDEYLPQEQDDALEVLAWIAAQPWCTGTVGMFGKSWGGFNCLQIAARRPPQLKAIVPMHFTDDRYADDVHYMGGCLLASQMLPWASIMLAYNGAPPDPRFVGDRWREMWLARLEQTPPFIEEWLRHQRRDAYWKHGSAREDYGAIDIPVYAVGGWSDAYNNSVPRLMAGLAGPRKALIGPWSHNFPETGVPGPAVGFLQEMVRWWDTWLKGIDNGIMDEPMFRFWLPQSVLPATFYSERPGRWAAEESWPSSRIQEQQLFLNSDGATGSLHSQPAAALSLSLLGLMHHGFSGGEWGSHGLPGEMAADQRAADGEALSFTSAPLPDTVEMVGYAQVELSLAVDQPLALVAARLCDVAPTGESTLVTWGLLNLTHRDSHEAPEPCEPGRRYQVTIPLNVTAYRMPAGHRWRVSVSPTYAYHAWPSPRPVTLTLFSGAASSLKLPLRPPRPEDEQLRPFDPPEVSSPLATESRRTGARRHWLQRDVIDGRTEARLEQDDGCIRFSDNGLEMESSLEQSYIVYDGDPLATAQTVHHHLAYRRGDWQVRIATESSLTSDAGHFLVTNVLHAYEGRTRVFSRTSTARIPRDHL
jgi:uncharacterized protein